MHDVITLAVGIAVGLVAAWCWLTNKRLDIQRDTAESLASLTGTVRADVEKLTKRADAADIEIFNHGRDLDDLFRRNGGTRYKRGTGS